jgi:hypothetical protein
MVRGRAPKHQHRMEGAEITPEQQREVVQLVHEFIGARTGK